MKKTILGLDLGTNSIGWALIEQDFENKQGNILGMGSRIIPMSQDMMNDFGKGNSISQTAVRTHYRGIRRLRERHLLRRERLHRVLNILGFLPEHYSKQIDFEKRLGQFYKATEPKIAYNNKDFIFKKSFEEMLEDFRMNQPELLNRKNKKGEDAKIPYDWTIYYLRKKGLTQKLQKEELAWLLLNFNQKRGYYQLRGEDDEASSNIKEYVEILKVVKIEKGNADKKKDKKFWYKITLENGWIHESTFSIEPQWLGKEKEFLISEKFDDNGNIKIIKDRKKDKEGKEDRKISPLPTFEEIDLMSKKDQDKIYKKIKVKTELMISKSGKTVGSYIYDTLLQNPNQKIRGKLIRTIERKFYKEELIAILKKQIELLPELFSRDLYNDCIRELYRNNESHQFTLSKRNFVHLFVEDILFYQRPLKSQKSSISSCNLEFRPMKDKNGALLKDTNGNQVVKPLKVISKSHPLYQEFRVWQWLYNLKIYKKEDNTDITPEFIKSIDDVENLFAFLMTKKEVNHKDILDYFITPIIKEKFPNAKPKALKDEIAKEIGKYRWNYVFDDSQEKEEDKSKKYPMNETGYEIRKRLGEVSNVPNNFLTPEIEQRLWHIIYSVTDKKQYEAVIENFVKRYNKKQNTKIEEKKFKEAFIKFPPFKNEYGAYSEKAIKKLLPLMRLGKYWKWEAIDNKTKNRIDKIITGEYDHEIKNRVREKAIHLTEKNQFQGLQLWLAQYIVYDRHSEAALTGKWKLVSDLEEYIHNFRQHSLRNPIVEQVVTETLRVVKDIWKKYGHGMENYFDEIHIELGREMKNTSEERKKITNQFTENENTNHRIKQLIIELKDNSDGKLPVENVRPYSPMQQEALKIYEDGVLNSDIEIPDDIIKISKTAQPTKAEIIRYKLWLEQKYRSPYTGEIIPLSKLFTEAYQIEHIIPQSRYFDDSLSNKVICETAINQLKDNQLGLEFIKSHHGEIVETSNQNKVKVFSEQEYKDFIKQHYSKNNGKRNKLLLEEIPDKMIERQLNDTRYISKFISNMLSNIVRADKDDDGLNSKNLIPGNGKITSILKQDWGLNDVWNELILPRFERMNELTNSKDFTTWNESHQKFLPTVPFELSRGFQKKRIDHRHHALDALVIACATRDHINLLNNIYAKSKERFDLNRKLRRFEKVQYTDKITNKLIEKEVPKNFLKPWNTITEDTREMLEKIIVSFKQNLRVINKTTNKHEKLVLQNGKKIKKLIPQKKGDSWAIRKPLHKDTVYGKVELQGIKVSRGKILTATRQGNDLLSIFKDVQTKEKAEEIILKITDTGIQKILKNYLASKNNNPELAFSPEAIEEMNKKISQYNNGKPHQPIYKVRIFKETGEQFPLGQLGNKKNKYVTTAKGTNLFFAVYADRDGRRIFDTIPLDKVIERQKQGLTSVPETKEGDNKLLFHLSPNDIVYVPTEDEKENINGIDFTNLNKQQVKRVFVVNDFSSTCYFTPNHLANNIAPKEVDLSFDTKKNKVSGSFDTKTASFEGVQIKEVCIKLKVDRLGNVYKV